MDRGPAVVQDIKTDVAVRVNVRVNRDVASDKDDLWRRKGIVVSDLVAEGEGCVWIVERV